MKIVVFSGAGMSADSGISTFRDNDGLWARYRIEDVCTPQALERNRDQVIEFYNIRRKELLSKEPNAGHLAIAELEKHFKVEIVTQNIDDLHERAGSGHVLHLHGELRKLRSSVDPDLIVPIEGWKQDPAGRAPDGSLLRPFVVFFGESVPNMYPAERIVSGADVLIIVGTSLAVYPAASLVNRIRPDVEIYLVDPATPEVGFVTNPIRHYRCGAAEGMPQVVKDIVAEYGK